LFHSASFIIPDSRIILVQFCFIVILDYSLVFRVTYTRCRIDTINFSVDRHVAARNM